MRANALLRTAGLNRCVWRNRAGRCFRSLRQPGSWQRLQRDLDKPRNGRSLGEHLRRQAGIDAVKAALLFEVLDKAALALRGSESQAARPR